MTNPSLNIAPGLDLPVEAVTQTFAILAKRGVGKSYTASVLAEEMLDTGAQVVVIDPLDAWWGLRSSADGNHPGKPIYVFGDPASDHTDLPLDPDSGSLVADVIVDDRISVVLSLRHMSKTKARKFVADFAERLYHRKGEPSKRTPLHVFIDEADAFCPQRVAHDTARVHGSIDDLVRRGRSAGLGVTLISQRAAVVSKDVLTQCEVLIALQTVSPQDRKALDEWIKAHDGNDQRDEFIGSLASLHIGEAWVWSPAWLELFQRVHIRARTTFDSSSTPKFGDTQITPTARADVDLVLLAERMAATVEKVNSTDPKRLQAKIRELEQQLAARTPKSVTVEIPVEVPVEVHVVPPELLAMLDKWQAEFNKVGAGLAEICAKFSQPTATPNPVKPVPPSPTQRGRRVVAAKPSSKSGETRILLALAASPRGLTKSQIGTLARLATKKSGTYGTYMSRLRSKGFVVETNGIFKATPEGIDYVGGPFEPETPESVQAHWLSTQTGGARAMLQALIDMYPESCTREELAEMVSLTPTAGTFGTYLSRLKSNLLMLVDDNNRLSAHPNLFEW